MGIHLEVDQYAYLDSPIHRWNPRYKLIGMMALIFAFAFVRDLRLIPPMLLVAVSLFGLSRLPLDFLQTRLRYPGLFLLGLVIALPFLVGKTVLWQWGILALRQEGILALLLVVGRFLSIVTVGIILFGTTPFLRMIRAMQSLGLPPLLADMVLLSYRYLFELAGTLVTMQRAMRLRGFGHRLPNGTGLKATARQFGQLAALAGTLIIRSFEQSEQVYRAMRLRGYGYQRSLSPRSPLAVASPQQQQWDGAGLAIALVISASFVIVEILLTT